VEGVVLGSDKGIIDGCSKVEIIWEQGCKKLKKIFDNIDAVYDGQGEDLFKAAKKHVAPKSSKVTHDDGSETVKIHVPKTTGDGSHPLDFLYEGFADTRTATRVNRTPTPGGPGRPATEMLLGIISLWGCESCYRYLGIWFISV